MRKGILVLLALLVFTNTVIASDSASVNLQFTIPPYVSIKNLTSPVLLANVVDRTGTLHQPLFTKYRVISNKGEGTQLFLKATATTTAGEELAFFNVGSQVYLAFTNTSVIPEHSALQNCKYNLDKNSSPRVIAYPVTSILGAPAKYSRGRYEVTVKNGVTDITVMVGTHVLSSSFGSNDPLGFYKATVVLTETDI